jgi:hypothetical protein
MFLSSRNYPARDKVRTVRRSRSDVLTASLLNLHVRFHLHNDLYRRWMGTLARVPQPMKSSAELYRERILAS